MRTLSLFFALLIAPAALAQQVEIYGYVKSESIYDTRQVAQVREGQNSQYVLRPTTDDPDGFDANAQDNFMFAAFQSRIGFRSSQADILGGTASGVVEADFFGHLNPTISNFRLRSAFVTWTKDEHTILAGQQWTPLFTAGDHPRVIGFATGLPFQPFGRHPQLRYEYDNGKQGFLFGATTQRDAFQEIGGNKMQHQAAQPAFHMHLTQRISDAKFGVGGTTKKILYRIGEPSFRANAVTAYARVDGDNWSLLTKSVIGDDLADHLMPGGFVTTTDGDVLPLRVRSAWADFQYQPRDRWTVGLYAGHLVNLGSADEEGFTIAERFTRFDDMQSMWRVSPRVSFQEGPLRLALEIEATGARFATQWDDSFKPLKDDALDTVVNVRTLLAAYYTF